MITVPTVPVPVTLLREMMDDLDILIDAAPAVAEKFPVMAEATRRNALRRYRLKARIAQALGEDIPF